MFLVALSLAAALGGAADAAPAAGQAAPAAATTPTGGPDPDKVVCRYFTMTGSRVPDRRRVCMKQREWDQDEKAAQTDTRKMQNSLYHQDVPGAH